MKLTQLKHTSKTYITYSNHEQEYPHKITLPMSSGKISQQKAHSNINTFVTLCNKYYTYTYTLFTENKYFDTQNSQIQPVITLAKENESYLLQV